MGSNNLNLTNMQSVAMNMMAFKNSKQGISQSSKSAAIKGDVNKEAISRSFTVNRTFGKDITNKVLNQSGVNQFGSQ